MNGRDQKWFVDGSEYKDPSVVLYDIEDGVRKLVNNVSGPKKVSANLSCVLVKEDPRTDVSETDLFGARSGTHTITVQLGKTYEVKCQKMLESLAKFQKNGSGWRLQNIEFEVLEIGIVRFDPLSGSGYSKLPPVIMRKKAVINMRNEKCEEGKRISDELKQCECKKCEEAKMCFKWAVTRALNPVNKNAERITKNLENKLRNLSRME